MIYSVASPTRVDFAGGTLDCWPLHLFLGDCVTINLAINIQTYVELKPRTDKQIHLDITDLKYKKSFLNLEELLQSSDPEMALVQSHLRYWQPQEGFALKTSSETPVGGGLGGSSSLSISLLKAFSNWLDKDLDLQTMILLASNMEAQVLKTPTGTQDYVPAIVGGLNAIHYTVSGLRVEALPMPSLTESMFLVYTGKPHHSGLNNWQVIKSIIDGDKPTLAHLARLQDVAWQMYEALQKPLDLEVLGDIFRRELEARVQLFQGFSSPEIEQLRDLVLRAGGQAVKICGAGGGGCVMVWTAPERKARVVQECQQKGFRILEVNPVPAIEA